MRDFGIISINIFKEIQPSSILKEFSTSWKFVYPIQLSGLSPVGLPTLLHLLSQGLMMFLCDFQNLIVTSQPYFPQYFKVLAVNSSLNSHWLIVLDFIQSILLSIQGKFVPNLDNLGQTEHQRSLTGLLLNFTNITCYLFRPFGLISHYWEFVEHMNLRFPLTI